MATDTTLMTAAEYARLPDTGVPTELVRGEVVEMNQLTPRHGQVCGRTDRLMGTFADEHELGHVLCNDAGIITERDPDTVRGGDVWFVSYRKLPKGALPDGYLDVIPDLIVEVRSEPDRWKQILEKVLEYLNAGVPVMCVLDPQTETARLYYPDAPEVILSGDDEITFPDQLPGFSVPVRRFFE
jgi:Uma2 family endonuclease